MSLEYELVLLLKFFLYHIWEPTTYIFMEEKQYVFHNEYYQYT